MVPYEKNKIMKCSQCKLDVKKKKNEKKRYCEMFIEYN